MNNSADSHNQDTLSPTGKQLPPVLARVPWLAGSNPSVSSSNPNNAALFEPHSVVASPGLGVSDSASNAPKYRFDPPQSRADNLEAHLSAAAVETERSETTAGAQQATAVAKVVRPLPSDQQTRIELRFDKPDSLQVETKQTVPEPEVQSTLQPLSWHHTVAKIDDWIRKYNRLIVIAALVTAAGLMLLVLSGNPGPVEQAPDSHLPGEDHTASQPEFFDMSGIPPLVINEPDSSESNNLTIARGPQSHSRNRANPSVESPQQFDGIELAPLEPHREPLATALVPIEGAALEPGSVEVEGPALSISRYPSTIHPEATWPAIQTSPQTDHVNPPVARLSRELKPVEEQRRK